MLRTRWFSRLGCFGAAAVVPASGLTAWALGGGFVQIVLAAGAPIYLSTILSRWRDKGVRPSGTTAITFTAAAAAYGVFAWAVNLFDRQWWLGLLMIIVIAVPMRWVANVALRAEVEHGQALRDAAAQTIAREV